MYRLSVVGLCSLALLVCAGALGAADDVAHERREQYELMKLFVESFQQIESNYVTEVDRRELMEAAIRGMIFDSGAFLRPTCEKNAANE